MNTHMTSTLAQCVWRRQWSLWVNAGPGGDGSAAVYVPQPTQLGRYSAKRFNSPFCAQHCISTFYAQLASGPLNDIYCTTHQAYLTWLIAHRAVPEHEVRPVLIQINWRADKAQLEYFNLKMCFGHKEPPPWEIYCMRKYERFSRGTCHHCNILKQHLKQPWETLIDPPHCRGWINIGMTSECIFYSFLSRPLP